jgi:hypothetical protein
VQLFVENLLKVLKVLKTVVKGRPASDTGKSRHALRTAHRAYRMTIKAKSDKTFFRKPLDKTEKVWYNPIKERELKDATGNGWPEKDTVKTNSTPKQNLERRIRRKNEIHQSSERSSA